MKLLNILHGRSLQINSWPLTVWLVLCALIALLLEGLAFNHFYFRYHLGDYQVQEVNIPYNEAVKGNAVLLDASNKQISINNLNVPVFSVAVSLIAPEYKIEGRVLLTDDSSLVQSVPGNIFAVVPNLKTSTKVASYVKSNGNAHSITVVLDNLKSQALLTSLTLNPEPIYTFYFSRFLLLTLLFGASAVVFKLKLYIYKLSDLSSRARLVLTLGSMGFCLLVAGLMFTVVSPKNLPPDLLYDFTEKGYVLMGNKDQSYLLDFPKTREELVYFDPYVKTMDALNKGQLHFDVDIDPKLMTYEHPYDFGARNSEHIEGYWDHSFYKGKYYAYYGYGPVFTLYYPIYWITGKVPAPSVANFLGTLLCIASFFFACSSLLKFIRIDANALLLVLTQCGLVIGSYIIACEFYMSFYGLAPVLACFYLFLLLGGIYRLPFTLSNWSRRAYLLLSGISIVMIVLCRPHALIYALIFCVPVLWQLFINKRSALFSQLRSNIQHREKLLKPNKVNEQDNHQLVELLVEQQNTDKTSNYTWTSRAKWLDIACLCIPIVIGAVFTMYTNYARFDSIFEFGQIYCTGFENFLYNKFRISLDLLSHSFFYYFVAGFDVIQTFPFVKTHTTLGMDMGNYMYGINPLGFFASPIYIALFLMFCFIFSRYKSVSYLGHSSLNQPAYSAEVPLKDNVSELEQPYDAALIVEKVNKSYEIAAHKVLKIVMSLSLIALPFIFYLQFLLASYTVRYTTESMLALAPFILISVMCFVGYKSNKFESQALYVIVCWCAIKSFILGILGSFWFLMSSYPFLVPDTLIVIGQYLSPLTTLY